MRENQPVGQRLPFRSGNRLRTNPHERSEILEELVPAESILPRMRREIARAPERLTRGTPGAVNLGSAFGIWAVGIWTVDILLCITSSNSVG